MASIKANFDLDRLKKLTIRMTNLQQLSVGDKAAKDIAKEVRDLMLQEISRGRGTVSGFAALKRYKDPNRTSPPSYAQQIKRGKFPGKSLQPVNLKLSGDFLNDLKVLGRIVGSKLEVSFSYATSLSQKKERGHATGHNGQPKRPTLPAKGQKFSAVIQDKIRERFLFFVNKLIKAI